MDIITSALHDAFTPLAISFALAAIGINVHFGYTGLLNFGQAAFCAVGAYGMGALIAESGAPLILGVLLGLAVAVVLALILGIPTLRLRADYLAIATIASAEAIRLFFSTSFKSVFHARDGVSNFTDGFRSLNPYPDGRFFGYSDNDLWVMTVGWGLVILISLYLWLLMKSPWGRVLKSIREDEEAVRSLGKNVYGYKLQALVLGGVIGSVGGMIGALGDASVVPDSFNTDFTFISFTMLILGGAARILGPVVGAALFWGLLALVREVLSALVDASVISPAIMDANQISNVRFMLVGLALMLLMIFRPQGIFGDRKEVALDAR